jgi:hypothetical protein
MEFSYFERIQKFVGETCNLILFFGVVRSRGHKNLPLKSILKEINSICTLPLRFLIIPLVLFFSCFCSGLQLRLPLRYFGQNHSWINHLSNISFGCQWTLRYLIITKVLWLTCSILHLLETQPLSSRHGRYIPRVTQFNRITSMLIRSNHVMSELRKTLTIWIE